MRICKVEVTPKDADGKPMEVETHLIRAESRAKAAAHVMEIVSVSFATPEDMAELFGKGVEVRDAE